MLPPEILLALFLLDRLIGEQIIPFLLHFLGSSKIEKVIRETAIFACGRYQHNRKEYAPFPRRHLTKDPHTTDGYL